MSVDLIIKSVINFIESDNIVTDKSHTEINSAKALGISFEEFIKDLFLDKSISDNQQRVSEIGKVFSLISSSSNPPDAILKNSFAIEIKKSISIGAIALNSSHPRDTLSSNDTMIKEECANIDGGNWTKEVFYYLGEVPKTDFVKSLFIIEGSCFSASNKLYIDLKNRIKSGILDIPNIVFEETNELGKIKNIDPYCITDLRIRGMWNIKHPAQYLPKYLNNFNKKYSLTLVMTYDKYESVNDDIKKQLRDIPKISIEKQKLPNPNNLANLIDIVLIQV